MSIRSSLGTIWSYRRAVLLGVVLVLLAWFLVSNRRSAYVEFPFNISVEAPVGLIVLASALLGALAGVLILSLYRTFR
jgi:uncharacterized integral membrane protein